MITALLNNRLVRYALLLTAGIAIGYVYVKGENRALHARIDHQDEVMKEWQESIIKIAEVPKLNVTNQISDVKVKRGSELVFVPDTDAQLIEVKPIEPELIDSIKTKKKEKDGTIVGNALRWIF